jgi:hypothetical protein
MWENTSDRAYIQSLKSPQIQTKLQSFLNSDFPSNSEGIANTCLNTFQNIIQEAGKNSLKIKKRKKRCKIRNTTNKKWFDKECRLKRHAVRKLANKKHRDPLNTDIRSNYHKTLKDYKEINIKNKERSILPRKS